MPTALDSTLGFISGQSHKSLFQDCYIGGSEPVEEGVFSTQHSQDAYVQAREPQVGWDRQRVYLVSVRSSTNPLNVVLSQGVMIVPDNSQDFQPCFIMAGEELEVVWDTQMNPDDSTYTSWDTILVHKIRVGQLSRVERGIVEYPVHEDVVTNAPYATSISPFTKTEVHDCYIVGALELTATQYAFINAGNTSTVSFFIYLNAAPNYVASGKPCFITSTWYDPSQDCFIEGTWYGSVTNWLLLYMGGPAESMEESKMAYIEGVWTTDSSIDCYLNSANYATKRQWVHVVAARATRLGAIQNAYISGTDNSQDSNQAYVYGHGEIESSRDTFITCIDAISDAIMAFIAAPTPRKVRHFLYIKGE